MYSECIVLPRAVPEEPLPKELHGRILAISNRSLCSRPFLEQLRRVCLFHPAALVLREKDLTEDAYEALARQVLDLCASYQVPCILHSFPEAARRLGVTEIHLPLWKLREVSRSGGLGGFGVIGVSIHSVEEALEAQKLGAGYLTAGHIYATNCKKGVPPRGIGFLKDVCSAVSLPVFAIGGIRLDGGQMRDLMGCNAVGGCIMSGMMEL